MWRWAVLLASVTAGLVAYIARPNGPTPGSTETVVPDHSADNPSSILATPAAAVKALRSKTKAELLGDARDLGIPGRSKMTKDELVRALRSRSATPS